MTERISKEQVKNAAKLAGLAFDEKEIEQFGSYLTKIIIYMENLNELDTENVPPTSHVLDIKARMRKDVVRAGNAGEKALEGAPESADGFFSIPKVMED